MDTSFVFVCFEWNSRTLKHKIADNFQDHSSNKNNSDDDDDDDDESDDGNDNNKNIIIIKRYQKIREIKMSKKN